MINEIYAVYDRGTEAYRQPFFALKLGQAMRIFSNAVNDAGTELHANPEDFVLYKVGEFDSESGLLHGQQEPVRIVTASDVLIGQKEEIE